MARSCVYSTTQFPCSMLGLPVKHIIIVAIATPYRLLSLFILIMCLSFISNEDIGLVLLTTRVITLHGRYLLMKQTKS